MKRHRQLLLLIAVAIYLLQLLQYRGYLLDDSFISLRYARNLVDGQGLVFNPGERVEGYTNFLFVLVAAVFLRIGIEPIAGLKWLGAAMALWVLWLLRTLERRMTSGENSERSPPFSVALLLPLPAFAYWSVCPMETMWFTALLLWALSLTLGERTPRRLNGAALVFVLLSLTRPEGAYLFAVWTGILLILDYRRGDRAILLVRYVQGVAIFAGLFGGDVVWRHQYYGSWLPNTFHAKVVGGEGQLLNGLSYLKDWLLAFPVLATVLLLPVGLVSRRTRVGRNVPQSVTALYLLTIAYIIYVVLIGGDFMPFFRFLLPIMPVCCLLLAWVWRDVVVPRAPGAIAVAIVVWVCTWCAAL